MRTLNDIIRTKKARIFIAVLTIGVGLASFIFAYLKPPAYDTSISFSINRTIQQDTSEYQYDGYYAIQASDLFSQTVMSWFMTPSVLLEMYNQAGVDPRITSIEQFTSRFKTKKYSPQNIVVRFQERDQDTAKKISQAIIKTVEEKAVQANKTEKEQAYFAVDGAQPVIVEKKPSLLLVTIIGLIAGFTLSVIILYITASLQRAKQPDERIM